MQFSHNGVSIHYEVMGVGNPLLLVHGWGGTLESLRALAKLFSESHKCILVDLPGFGDSDTPQPDWGNKEYAYSLLGLLDHLKIKKTDYFGHSFGGALGIYLGATTNRINHLILCNSSYKRNNKQSKIARFTKHLIPKNNPALKLLLYRIFFHSSDLARYPQLESNFRRIVAEDLSPLLKDIHIPTLIVWGEDDAVTPVSFAHDLHTQIEKSKLKILSGQRHALPIREPKLVMNAVESFI